MLSSQHFGWNDHEMAGSQCNHGNHFPTDLCLRSCQVAEWWRMNWWGILQSAKARHWFHDFKDRFFFSVKTPEGVSVLEVGTIGVIPVAHNVDGPSVPASQWTRNGNPTHEGWLWISYSLLSQSFGWKQDWQFLVGRASWNMNGQVWWQTLSNHMIGAINIC